MGGEMVNVRKTPSFPLWQRGIKGVSVPAGGFP